MSQSKPTLFRGLSTAGFNPDDDAETRLKKSLLIFATGLVSLGSMLWLFLYWQMGPKFSSTAPFVFQLLLVSNLIFFLKSGNFNFFRYSQLALFLFMPFVVQWSIGNFITASGISLWGLLAPIGAVLFFGVRESAAWFFAYIFLTALSGFFDYFLADSMVPSGTQVPIRVSVFFFALNFAAVSTIVYLLLRYSTQEKSKAQASLEETHRLLQDEQDRSERLLLNILPGPIAERLKHEKQTIADGFADVTVMFVDIVNFTKLAEGMSPQQVFAMLNRIFSSFDELAEKFGVEKIKTIGDAYMAVAGAPDDDPDHEFNIARAALRMRKFIERRNESAAHRWRCRIGLGWGPAIGSVVGLQKYVYDIFGPAVNLAARLESMAEPMQILASQELADRIRSDFVVRPVGTFEIKGFGRQQVFSLEAEARKGRR